MVCLSSCLEIVVIFFCLFEDADGSWKPGKKGIALRKAEFLEIKVLSSKVIEAFSTCEEFSGNVRSFYLDFSFLQ